MKNYLVFGLIFFVYTVPLLPPQTADDERREKKYIQISFQGNAEFEDKQLGAVIGRELDLVQSGNGSAGDLIDAVSNLESWYAEQGYPDADIRIRLTDTAGGNVSRLITDASNFEKIDIIAFVIDAGDRLYLADVEFSGNTAFDDDVLTRYVEQSGSLILGAGRPLYRASDIETTMANVRRHYELNGFLDVQVERLSTERSPAGVQVRIGIDEGDRYVIQSVSVGGIYDIPREIAAAVLSKQPDTGQYFRERIAAEGAEAMESILGRYGFFTDVRYKILTRNGTAAVFLVYEFDPVPQSVMGNINIRTDGEKQLWTNKELIKNRFELKPGEPVDRSKIEEGRRRLYQTGLFDFVSVEIESRDGLPEDDIRHQSNKNIRLVDVIIRVKESENQYAALSGGYNNVDQFIGMVEYVNENIFGTGRRWSIAGEASFRGYRISTRLSDRLLFGPSSVISLGFENHFRLREGYTELSVSGNVLADLSLCETLRTTADYSFSYSQIEDLSAEGAGLRNVRIGRLDLGLLFSTVDSAVTPRSGVEAEAGFGYSGGPLGSQIQFIRLSALFSVHLQLNPLLIITLHTEGETILPELSGSIPISKRLYAGGSNSVRSFPEDTLSPVDANGVPLGGLTHIEGTIEIRIQLIGNLVLALFSDIGMVSRDPFSITKPGFGIGLGLRYRLPIGPLRLDLGYNPGPRFASDSTWALHFSIGSGF